MSRLNIERSKELYQQGLELIPWASQTTSKRPTEYAFGAFPIYIECGQVAAVMLSPVSYYEVSDGSYLRRVRELCDQHEVVLIYDEIVTGFRLALGGAQEYFGVLPDLSCFTKGIANGYPVACLCGRREVMNAMQTAVISSTYGGEAISLAALVACVREYQEKNVTDFLNAQGQKLMDGLNAAAQKIGVQARWLG